MVISVVGQISIHIYWSRNFYDAHLHFFSFSLVNEIIRKVDFIKHDYNFEIYDHIRLFEEIIHNSKCRLFYI